MFTSFRFATASISVWPPDKKAIPGTSDGTLFVKHSIVSSATRLLEIFSLDIKDGKEISIKPKKVDQNTKRLWGMNRSLINNAVIGSSKGYEKILELVGVGYRAALKGNQLNLQLGYSHDINFDIPEGIKISVEKQTTLKILGANKQQVGAVASKLKTFRKIEPYKGKGVREKGQYILKKEGKKK